MRLVFNCSSVNKKILSWSQRVDINCFRKMMDYKGNYLAQFIWLLILLGSTGATYYLIVTSLMDFLRFEATSQINIVNEMPVKFPTVTFCDNNPFSSIHAQYLMQNISVNFNTTDKGLVFKLTKYLASYKKFQIENFPNERSKKLLGSPLEIGCYFRGKDCQEYLTWYWSFNYGNCIRFNSGVNTASNKRIDVINVTSKGKDNGLDVWVCSLLNRNKYFLSGGRGLVVYVHNNTFKPSEAVFVQPGTVTYISTKRTFTEKYPSPYSDCIDLDSFKSDLYDYIIKSNKTYRQQDCFELCIQKSIIDKCKCYYTRYDSLNSNVRPCLNPVNAECLNKEIDTFDLEECQAKLCPYECDSMLYDLSLSSLEFSDENIYDEVNEEFNLKKTNSSKSTCASFKVYFPTLQYTHIKETPKTKIIDLFTQIGGSLGMFVSFSIFTLFELIEIVVLIVREGFL